MTPSITRSHKKAPSICSKWELPQNTNNSRRIRVCLEVVVGEASLMCDLTQASLHIIRLHRLRIPCHLVVDSHFRWFWDLGATWNMQGPLGKVRGGTGMYSHSGPEMRMITVPIRPLTVVDTNGQLLELIGL